MTAIDVYVDPSVLVRHSDFVAAIAAEMRAPRDAAAYVRLDRSAYGVFCAAIPVLLDSLAETVESAMGAVTGDVAELARRLGQAAQAYRSADSFDTAS